MDFKSERGKGIARMDWEEGERTKNRKNYWKGPKYVLKKSGSQCTLLFLIRHIVKNCFNLPLKVIVNCNSSHVLQQLLKK